MTRRVGRQPGVKNRKRKAPSNIGEVSHLVLQSASFPRDSEDLPNPLHVLASEATRRNLTPE